MIISNIDDILTIIRDNKSLTRQDYIYLYLELMELGKQREADKSKDQYYEIHHILPKSKGGDNSKENLVRLTVREHVLSHILLYLAYPEDGLFAYTVFCLLKMCNTRYRTKERFSKEELLSELNLLETDIIEKSRRYSSLQQENKVVCFDIKSYKVLRVYRSPRSAYETDGFRIEGIYSYISGKQTEVGGCGFSYFNSFLETHYDELDEYFENLSNGFLPNIDEYRVESGRLHKRAIVAFDDSLKVVGVYDSIRETEEFGCDEKCVWKSINRKCKHKGYNWDYYDNFITYGKQYFEEFISSGAKNLSEFHDAKREYKTQKVAMCDITTGDIIKIYNSIREAEDDGHDGSSIWRVTSGIMSKHHGHTWKYLED